MSRSLSRAQRGNLLIKRTHWPLHTSRTKRGANAIPCLAPSALRGGIASLLRTGRPALVRSFVKRTVGAISGAKGSQVDVLFRTFWGTMRFLLPSLSVLLTASAAGAQTSRAASPPNIPRIIATPLHQIAATSSTGAVVFERAGGAALLSPPGIVLADRGSNQLLRFDGSGVRVGAAGGTGQDPGNSRCSGPPWRVAV